MDSRLSQSIGFDEVLINRPIPGSDSREAMHSWLLLALFVLFSLAAIFPLLAIVSAVYWNWFPMIWPIGSDAMTIQDDTRPLNNWWLYWSNIGQAATLPIGLATLGILCLSAILIRWQIRQDQTNSLESALPAVNVKPRLSWRLCGLSETAKGLVVISSKPVLSLELQNFGDTPAIKLQVRIEEVFLHVSLRKRVALQIDPIQSAIASDMLRPADRTAIAGDGATLSVSECMTLELPLLDESFIVGSRMDEPSLLKSLLAPSPNEFASPGTDFPALVVMADVSFETLRRMKFRDRVIARWSFHRCRGVQGCAEQQVQTKGLIDALVHKDVSKFLSLSLAPEASSINDHRGSGLYDGYIVRQ